MTRQKSAVPDAVLHAAMRKHYAKSNFRPPARQNNLESIDANKVTTENASNFLIAT